MGADNVPHVTDRAASGREYWPNDEHAPTSGGHDQYGLSTQPVSGGFAAPPLSGDFAAPAPQRRIVPSPPPQRGKLLRGVIVGVLAGALVAGVGAFVLGRTTAPDSTPVAAPQSDAPAEEPAPAAAPPEEPTDPFATANRAAFPDDLIPLAEPWLADMSSCAANTDDGGPALGPGERAHVLCRDGGMYLHFVAYQSAEGRAADLSFRQRIARGSASDRPDAEEPGEKLGGVTGAPGMYVEYTTPTGEVPALCGIWWNPDGTDTAVFVDVLCDSLGGNWDSLRSVWQRHS